MPAPGARLLGAWRRLAPLPLGPWLFNRLLAFMNPYSGAVGARVQSLEPGHAVLALRDRRAIRNHLDSVHAIALANVLEMASGLAMLSALPEGARGIVLAIKVDYLKKARGTLTAESRVSLPDVSVNGTHEFTSAVRDLAGDEVARATVTWRLGPEKAAGGRQQALP